MNESFSTLKGPLYHNHSLTEYSSWKIGGPAEYFYRPVDSDDFVHLLQLWPKEGPITILGAATNVLIRDGGIKGLVIYLCNNVNQVQELDPNILRAEAGASLMDVVRNCQSLGMVEAAFMAGIPGTVGGALTMNASAYGGCIWNHVQAVETIDRYGRIKLRAAHEFAINYRQVDGLAQDEWFLAAHLKFMRGEAKEAEQQVQMYLQKRQSAHPLNLPNCGSVFRNPQGHHAAKLIEASGLKGRQIGNAKVSEKHANFIVNCGNATASDVEDLMREITEAVSKSSGIKLIPEVHILGNNET